MTCGASAVEPLIGQPQSALSSVSLPAPVRMVPPGSAMTMDYRADRTNIDLDDAGRIVRAWCG